MDWEAYAQNVLGKLGARNVANNQLLGAPQADPTQPQQPTFNGYGMAPAIIHHNEFVNGAQGYTGFDQAGTTNLIQKLGHQPFDADSAGAYQSDFGTTVYFFKNGKAIKSVDLNALPQ